MKASVQFYRDVLGMEVLYAGGTAGFSSLRAKDADSAILNLEQGERVNGWGRLIFHVADVDALWRRFNKLGSSPKSRRMLRGANGISICSIRMGMSCRLRARCGQAHEHREP